jgi:iron(III) transport system permease protein
MSVEIYNLWSNGSYPVVAALGIVLLVVLALLILIARFVASRFGVGGKNLFQGGQE